MTNHVHLLISPNQPNGITRLMQSLGRRYAQYVNRFTRAGVAGEAPIGAGRLLQDGHIDRMAVLKPWRGRGTSVVDGIVATGASIRFYRSRAARTDERTKCLYKTIVYGRRPGIRGSRDCALGDATQVVSAVRLKRRVTSLRNMP